MREAIFLASTETIGVLVLATVPPRNVTAVLRPNKATSSSIAVRMTRLRGTIWQGRVDQDRLLSSGFFPWVPHSEKRRTVLKIENIRLGPNVLA